LIGSIPYVLALTQAVESLFRVPLFNGGQGLLLMGPGGLPEPLVNSGQIVIIPPPHPVTKVHGRDPSAGVEFPDISAVAIMIEPTGPAASEDASPASTCS